MNRNRLATLIVTVLFAAVLVAVFVRPVKQWLGWHRHSIAIVKIDSAQRMAEALNAPYAILMVDMEWSIFSKVVRIEIEKFAANWPPRSGIPLVRFYTIGWRDEKSIPEYFRKFRNRDDILGQVKLTGHAETFWIQDGVVQDWARLSREPRQTLLQRTLKNFGS